eukprot:3071468-Amphidinium_carterae.1
MEPIGAFWCACHKTTLPENCAYSLRCGYPNEGECGPCGDARAFECEHERCTKVRWFASSMAESSETSTQMSSNFGARTTLGKN